MIKCVLVALYKHVTCDNVYIKKFKPKVEHTHTESLSPFRFF